jgi:hypothetical protein
MWPHCLWSCPQAHPILDEKSNGKHFQRTFVLAVDSLPIIRVGNICFLTQLAAWLTLVAIKISLHFPVFLAWQRIVLPRPCRCLRNQPLYHIHWPLFHQPPASPPQSSASLP